MDLLHEARKPTCSLRSMEQSMDSPWTQMLHSELMRGLMAGWCPLEAETDSGRCCDRTGIPDSKQDAEILKS